MKLFIQDHGWAGATIVVAENDERAREIAKERFANDGNSYYFPNAPWDEIHDLDKELITEVMGDR
jgi:hypothetical protein